MIFDTQTEKLGVGYMTREGWAETQETLFAVGLIEKRIEPTLFYDNTFWTNYKK